jgi:hypothetical protein
VHGLESPVLKLRLSYAVWEGRTSTKLANFS